MQRMVNEEYTKGKEQNQQSNEVRRMETFSGRLETFQRTEDESREQRGGGLIATRRKEKKENDKIKGEKTKDDKRENENKTMNA